jgi:hypothetical protein
MTTVDNFEHRKEYTLLFRVRSSQVCTTLLTIETTAERLELTLGSFNVLGCQDSALLTEKLREFVATQKYA